MKQSPTNKHKVKETTKPQQSKQTSKQANSSKPLPIKGQATNKPYKLPALTNKQAYPVKGNGNPQEAGQLYMWGVTSEFE